MPKPDHRRKHRRWSSVTSHFVSKDFRTSINAPETAPSSEMRRSTIRGPVAVLGRTNLQSDRIWLPWRCSLWVDRAVTSVSGAGLRRRRFLLLHTSDPRATRERTYPVPANRGSRIEEVDRVRTDWTRGRRGGPERRIELEHKRCRNAYGVPWKGTVPQRVRIPPGNGRSSR